MYPSYSPSWVNTAERIIFGSPIALVGAFVLSRGINTAGAHLAVVSEVPIRSTAIRAAHARRPIDMPGAISYKSGNDLIFQALTPDSARVAELPQGRTFRKSR